MLTDRDLNLILAGGIPEGLPTPQATIEAVMLSVRQRGLAALREPSTLERLKRCDQAARNQIDARLTKLIEAGRVANLEEAANV
jgi:hypothetical protein